MEEILIYIEPDARVRIEGKGFSGKTCEELTKGLEDALGVVERRELKPEYRQAQPILRKK